MNERPVCHRAEDLVSYLYGETSETDARDFREHMKQCAACRNEVAAFSQVHESILVWRNEALGSSFNAVTIATEVAVDSTKLVRQEGRLPALAAIRQFFDVSPLWLRGATVFAALLLCVLLVVAISRTWQQPTPINSSETRFTQRDLDKAVAEARIQTSKELQASTPKPNETVTRIPTQGTTVRKTPPVRKPRIKGLTMEEREQLAADLRLIPGVDDDEFPFGISDQPDQ